MMDIEKLKRINSLHQYLKELLEFDIKAKKSSPFIRISIGSFNSNVKDHESVDMRKDSEVGKKILLLIEEEYKRINEEFNSI